MLPAGRKNPLFMEDMTLRKEFLNQTAGHTIPKGKIIFLEGESCPGISFITKGSVRVYKIGESGREITLYRLFEGESCILTASCILNRKPFPAISEAEEDTEVITVSAEVFRDWIERYSEWRNYVFGLLSERLTDVISIVEEIAFRQVDKRIAAYLLQKKNHFDEIQITHQLIANEIGTSREVVSRILKEFELRGMIEISRGAVKIKNQLSLQKLSE